MSWLKKTITAILAVVAIGSTAPNADAMGNKQKTKQTEIKKELSITYNQENIKSAFTQSYETMQSLRIPEIKNLAAYNVAIAKFFSGIKEYDSRIKGEQAKDIAKMADELLNSLTKIMNMKMDVGGTTLTIEQYLEALGKKESRTALNSTNELKKLKDKMNKK